MPAPDSVIKLCETFADHRDHYRSGNYNEAQLRKEFLDPLFAALGWDMGNTAGLAPQYRDVIHEDALRVGVHVKAPDYGFTLHGQRKFFLEAKKPAINIKSDIDPAYQLRRYAWSAKMPLSILSDFEEFAIYDTRVKPLKGDPPAKARTFYCTFDQYPEKWDQIAAIFSREAILKGSFDKYAESNKKKKGTAEVDADFLAEIERWRDLLARNLALRNPDLSVRDLNFAVQKTIDRIVFLRICEDRGTEDYGRLRSIANGTQTYPRLLEAFRTADQRYNSGLFHFTREKGQAEEPDTLTPHLALDDKVLKDIITHLYYPESSYEFSVMPADILGSVYEQFLGKVINLTAGHRAVVEDKPEVKKAGGVFYTPGYIVDYIVRQTLGPLTDGRTPKQIESVRVLDPACGSGSFLIVAYQFLLDWYHQYYLTQDPEKLAKGKNPVLVASRGGGWILTTAERKRILLAHIFGVDIDSQAVEVTKLSLLLKVLEGETAQSVQRELIHQRVLPDLGSNIKCGNSLIGSDFYAQPGLPAMDTDAQLRVNVFDWDGKDGFPDIMKAGGFDAVIGNPPYVRIQTLPAKEVAYLTSEYSSAATGNCDLYVSFVEKAYRLLRKDGQLGFIIPNKFLRTDYGVGIRRMISQESALMALVDFGASQVFSVTIYTCILILAKSRPGRVSYGTCDAHEVALKEMNLRDIASTEFGEEPWTLQTTEERDLNVKISRQSVKLLDLPANMGRGSSTGDDNVFVIESGSEDVETDALREPLFATDFGRYEFRPTGKWRVIFPYEVAGKSRLIAESDLKTQWPRTYRYLKAHESALRKRKQFKEWYGYSAPRNLEGHERAHIAVPLLANRGLFALIPETSRGKLCPMASGGFTITLGDDATVSTRYVLGLLNSKLLFWVLQGISNVFRGGWITCTKQYFGELPIRVIAPASKSDVAAHDQIVGLVEQMLDLHQRRAAAKTPHEQTALDRQISATDARIDRLVYDLYGLTEEEIQLVEGQ